LFDDITSSRWRIIFRLKLQSFAENTLLSFEFFFDAIIRTEARIYSEGNKEFVTLFLILLPFNCLSNVRAIDLGSVTYDKKEYSPFSSPEILLGLRFGIYCYVHV
jgi:F0F1-type ATP synthase membrane subunit a